jgi:hypothetical protein
MSIETIEEEAVRTGRSFIFSAANAALANEGFIDLVISDVTQDVFLRSLEIFADAEIAS